MRVIHSSPPLFVAQLRLIGIPEIHEGDKTLRKDFDESQLEKIANLNKISLFYSLMLGNHSREKLKKYDALVDTLREIGAMFSKAELKYSIFKTIKPFPTNPADIDVLVATEDLERAISTLQAVGFKKTAQDEYSATLQRENMIVDLQTQPSVSNLPYISKSILLNNAMERHIDGFQVHNLTPEAEIIVIASHSLYKEQMFTLNDYYTIAILAESADIKRVIELAKQSNTLDVLKLIVSVCVHISESAFGSATTKKLKITELSEILGSPSFAKPIHEMPLKFPFSLVIRMLARRAFTDREMRRSMLPAVLRMLSPSQLIKLISHIRRKTY